MEIQQSQPIFPFTVLVFSFICFLYIFFYQKRKITKQEPEKPALRPDSLFNCSLPATINDTHTIASLSVEFLSSTHPKFVSVDPSVTSSASLDDCKTRISLESVTEVGSDAGDDSDMGADARGKKKKKRGKKKKQNQKVDKEEGYNENENEAIKEKTTMNLSYPFTSSSVTQRKIKQQYDELVKSNQAKTLTLDQVGQFIHCLVEARSELQHKAETIQRKFTITKALLLKADRSSFDRLSQQISKLEAEHKRLEEDAAVYNLLQEQLKHSPAYKKMLEIGAKMELTSGSGQLIETDDSDFPEISFEELLAKEKKDSFWQKNGKMRSISSRISHDSSS